MIPDEQLAVNQRVADVFEGLGIRYYLCGSMAASYHGFYRATADADFVAAIKFHHIKPFVEQLKSEFYVDAEVVLEAVKEESSFNMLHDDTLLKVDIFVLKRDPFAMEQMARRTRLVSGGEVPPVFVATAEDTILSKLGWYRLGGEVSDRQWGDITGILKLQHDRVDRSYMAEWAKRTGVSDLLERALRESGL
jgi:hypothetical protein